MNRKAIILVATWNGAKYLGEQLDSLVSQVGVSVDIYIRDDGSTDRTEEIIRDYCEKYENIHCVTTLSKGGSASKNFSCLIECVDIDEETVVFFSDQDDVWMPDKVRTSCNKIWSGIDLYSSALSAFSGTISTDGSQEVIKPDYTPKKFDHLFQGLSAGCTYAMSAKLVHILKSKMLQDDWYKKNDFSHDWLVYTIARANKLKIHHDPIPKIFYRQHDHNVQGALSGLSGMTYRMKNISAPWYFGQIRKNQTFFEKDTEEYRVIAAAVSGHVIPLLRYLFQLRRSKLHCIWLFVYITIGRKNVQ